jgi:transcriptional regulator with XRE-family HTH domain
LVQEGAVAKKKGPPRLIDQLKEAIRGSGQTLRQLGRAAGVSADQISRFLRDHRTLTLPAVAKLCQALDLQLVRKRSTRRSARTEEE